MEDQKAREFKDEPSRPVQARRAKVAVTGTDTELGTPVKVEHHESCQSSIEVGRNAKGQTTYTFKVYGDDILGIVKIARRVRKRLEKMLPMTEEE